MQTKQQAEPSADGDKQVRQQFQAIIGEQVLHGLGQPVGYHVVQVRKLWDYRYRVNVFVGPDAVSAVVAHSYFLVTDENGTITATNPKITRKY